MELLSLISIATVVFASTNIDDILLLSALFADPKVRTRNIVIGQFIGIGALFLVSAIAGVAAVIIPPGWTALFGVVPLALGIRGLVALKSHEEESNDEMQAQEHRVEQSLHSQILAVSGITIANGGDNLGVYIPMFAKDPSTIPVFAAVFTVMTAAWCWAGYSLVNNPWIGQYVQRYGRRGLPFVLISLGIYLLFEARVLFE